jgi:hypothetical protein
MTDEERKYVRYLLSRIKDLYALHEAYKALIMTSGLPHRERFAADLEKNSIELLALPEIQRELDSKFQRHFEGIEHGLDQIEALEALLKAPIKGLPN